MLIEKEKNKEDLKRIIMTIKLMAIFNGCIMIIFLQHKQDRRVLRPMTLNRVYLSHGNRKKTTTLLRRNNEHGSRTRGISLSSSCYSFPFFFLFGDSKYISSSSHFNPPHLTPRARKTGTDAPWWSQSIFGGHDFCLGNETKRKSSETPLWDFLAAAASLSSQF